VNTVFRLLVLGALLPVSARAEPPVVREADIVVTATRRAQSAEESLAAVTVITRTDIAASQARDLADLLRFHAGLEIGRNGGAGQPASLFLRGTESNHTLVLIDGVRINPGTIGGANWQNLDPNLIDRVEIVRGPRSSLYGPDAIGGVIQIFTRRGQPGTTITTMAGAGQDATREGALGVHHGAGAWRAGIDLTGFATDGFPALRAATFNTGHRRIGVNAYAGLRVGALDVDVGRWQVQGNTEYYDYAVNLLDQDFRNSMSHLSLTSPLAVHWSTTLRFAQMTDRLDQNQSPDFGHTRRTTLDWQHDLQLGPHLLTAGVYAAREQTTAQSLGTQYDVRTDSQALFVQDQWRRGPHQVLLAWRHNNYDYFGTHHTGELAYGYTVTATTQVYATVATGFRAPDGTDRFGYGGNPDLRPETSRNIEVGLRSRVTPGQHIRVSAFRNDLDDLINYVDPDGFSGPQPGQNQNVDRARIQGLEMAYGWRARPWTVDLDFIAQNPENRDTGRLLARRATRSLTLAAGHDIGDGRVAANLLLTGSRWDSDYSSDRLSAYGVVDLYYQRHLGRDLVLRLRLENLFDKDYELADGYRVQGRALFIQIHYQPRIGHHP